MPNKSEAYVLIVDDVERRILIQALSDIKDKQKHEGKEFDFIDTLILKACDAPLARGKLTRLHEER